jgi:hypothetical protein
MIATVGKVERYVGNHWFVYQNLPTALLGFYDSAKVTTIISPPLLHRGGQRPLSPTADVVGCRTGRRVCPNACRS